MGVQDKQIKNMKSKFNEVLNPNSPYSHEDFVNEFGEITFEQSTAEFSKLKLNFVNESNNEDPEYATNGSSGFDLRANLPAPLVFKSGEIKIIPTGLFFDIPENFEIQVRPRSGLAAKRGITVLNSPGTVDSDYTGEVKVILINHGGDYVIEHGERIAQAIVATVAAKNIINLNKVDNITKNTERGSGGFGSTGTK